VKGVDIFGNEFHIQKQQKIFLSTLNQKYLFVLELLKTSSIRFISSLDTSLHGTQLPSKDAGNVVGHLTGIESEMKCLFIANRSCRYKT
jgi:hypothetical protein